MAATAPPTDGVKRAHTPSHHTAASEFLTVPELAALLHVNEKKVYQLAGDGALPGTKLTGRWLFPRSLIEDWLLENSRGGVMHDRLLLAGSDDQLIQRVCSQLAVNCQHHALIAYSPAGTRHGLAMLDSGRIDASFINWGPSEDNARRHLGLLRGYRNHASWVVVRCLQRSQGLAIAPHVLASANDQPDVATLLRATQFRWAARADDSGNGRLLADLCALHGTQPATLKISTSADSERIAVNAVHQGLADITCATESAARELGLGYIPVADVSLDLVMNRRTYFRTLLQTLIEQLQSNKTQAIADALGGYHLEARPQLLTME